MQLFKGQFPACHHFIYGAQRCLHNAAGHTENVGGSCSQPQWGIKLTFRQIHKIQSRLFDHPGQFPGGQDRIHITASVHFHLRALDLIFLCRTGHHGYNEHVLGIRAGALCIK